MGDGIPFLEIVFFAMVAGFILLRLRAVLGRRTGTEKPPTPIPAPGRDDNVVPIRDRDRSPAPLSEADTAHPGVAAIRRADPSFDLAEFLEGARSAYEMIVMAFAGGDTETLKPLLSEPVYQGFAQAIETRKRANQTMQTTLVGLKDAALGDAVLNGRMAEVTVRFEAEMINVTRDAQGVVVDGDISAVKTVTDVWTFARDTTSRDPNWFLIRTGSA